MRDNTSPCTICLAATLLLVGCNGTRECRNCNERSAERCSTSPVLSVSAGNGEATLEWEPAVGVGAAAKEWQFRQALQGESWSATLSAGPAATAYIVSDLTNDKAYTFQVRAQLDTADFACWSAPVTVVPRRRRDDVVEDIEKHQRAIAEHMAEVAKGMVDGQELLQALGEQGIGALKAVAASASEIAGHSAGIRDGVVQVAGSVDVAGENLAAATMAVEEQAAGIREEVAELAAIVDATGEKTAEELADIAARLGQVCDGCGARPNNCSERANQSSAKRRAVRLCAELSVGATRR